MVLFIVAVVMALLALGSLSLLSLMTTEYEATLLRSDEIQAGQLVQSGVEWLASAVDSPVQVIPVDASFVDPLAPSMLVTDHTGSELYDNPENFRGVEVVPANLGHFSRGAGRFTIFSPRIENDRHTGIRYGLVNESSRLHLGSVFWWELESPGQGERSLLKLPGMTPTMAQSILDWLDADKMPRPFGAELEFYEQSGVPYRPRNGIPVTLEELLWIREVARPWVFGKDTHFSGGLKMDDIRPAQNAAIPASEISHPAPATREATQETTLPWCFLLTTVSAEKLIDPQGTAKVYLNDKNLEFLEQQLTGFLGEESATFIVAWRKNKGDIKDPVDLLDAVVTDGVEEWKSPFSLENSAAEEKFLRLLDFATTHPEIIVTGRVNVNEAASVVLEAVPDLTEEMVRQIVNRRPKPGEKADGKFRHAIWLLSEKIVDTETMKKLSKRLTTGGDVYRAQIVGFFDNQGTTSRAEVVIDATVKPPRPIFSKDLSLFGSVLE